MLRPERRIVAQLIRDMRTSAGLKQADLAHQLGVTQSVVSKYETGERRLDILEIRAICAACGVDLPAFVTRLESRLHRSSNESR